MSTDNEELTKVYNTIEDQIFESHKFCTMKEITERVGKSRNICEKALQKLLSTDRIYIAYQRVGVPKIYIPKYMMNEILLTQIKPRWMENDRFEERKKIDKKLRKLKNELMRYDMFERLLYATGEPLEESVHFALEWLGTKNIQYHKEADKDIQDIDFKINHTKFLLEVKGKTKAADKNDVEQLNGWRKQEVLKVEEGKKIECILVINHWRRIDPKERKEVLTIPARKWLKMYGLKVITTPFLLSLIKDVEQGKSSKEEAIDKIIQGQKI